MTDGENMADSRVASTELSELPWRSRYSLVLTVLLLISIFNVSLRRNATASGDWSMEISVGVSAITLALLILLAAPVIAPWIIKLAPGLRSLFAWSRDAGIEEVEVAGLRIKLASLASGVSAAATAYATNILKPSAATLATAQDPESLMTVYTQMLENLETDSRVPSAEAIQRIDHLGEMYEEVRAKLPSGAERTQLLTQISSIMWSLMASVDEFDVVERISSPDGGRRLAAYKYIEAKAHTEQLDLLLSRAIGVLETPFGQYATLLALRRVVVANGLDADERDSVSRQLNWVPDLAYIAGTDREFLMRNILEVLKSD